MRALDVTVRPVAWTSAPLGSRCGTAIRPSTRSSSRTRRPTSPGRACTIPTEPMGRARRLCRRARSSASSTISFIARAGRSGIIAICRICSCAAECRNRGVARALIAAVEDAGARGRREPRPLADAGDATRSRARSTTSWRIAPASSSIARSSDTDSACDEDVRAAGGRETAGRFFLGVERSVCGRAWRDRLDERASARALSIVQRQGMPELLARVLAARGVEAEEVESFLDPTVKRLMPDPDRLVDMGRRPRASPTRWSRGEQVAIFGDYDVDGATSAALLCPLPARRRSRSDHPHPGPPVRRLRPQCRGGPRSRRNAGRRCWSRSIAAPPATSRSRRRDASASTSSSSTIIWPTSGCRPRSRWSTRTGSTISRASAIWRRSGSCS